MAKDIKNKTKKSKRPKLTMIGIKRSTKNRFDEYIKAFNNSNEHKIKLIAAYATSEAVEEWLDKQEASK